MTKLLLIISSLLIGGVVQAQMTSNPNSVYAGGNISAPGNPNTGAHYDWGRGRDGTGYCYQFTNQGDVLNGGYPVAEANCEAVRPSKADWGWDRRTGFGYCYQFTPDNLVMYQGRPQNYDICEKVNPSHYAWGRATNGWTYCFQFTPYNAVLNEGRAVANEKCY